MGLLNFLFGKRGASKSAARMAPKKLAPKQRTENASKEAWCDLPIVGESKYQDALLRICGGYTRDGHQLRTRAQLVPEPSNPYDKNAIRVDIDGQTVGYLKRDHAARYAKRLAEEGLSGEILDVRAYITGGWRTNQHDKGFFGVQLETPWPLKRGAAKK
ncbi:HIRAN domain-containing protein [Phenylobacterium sp.]|uniref:HIRAN domain-containing protein n=1 Tax=Phenylobacterium sp. TaxID=1871053 RepID=UPI0035B20EE6